MGNLRKNFRPNTKSGLKARVNMPKTRSKRKSFKSEEIKDSSPSVEDQVSLLNKPESKKINKAKFVPGTDSASIIQFLVNGVQSSSIDNVRTILDRTNEDIIEKTVHKIPVETVLPLLVIIQTCLQGRGSNKGPALWLQSLLTVHTGYIMSLPDSADILSPLSSVLEDRTKHYSSVYQLRGKLDMLEKQIREKNEVTEKGDNVEQGPLIMYQDDSSDDLENVIDDLLVPGSDSGDDWKDDDDIDDDIMNEDDSDDSIEIVNDDAMDDNSD